MDSSKTINILHVTIGDGNYGGIASFLHTFYSYVDHQRFHFDVLYCGENSLKSKESDPVWSDSKIEALHILKKNNGISEYIRLLPKLKKKLYEKDYDIVHVESNNPFLNACVSILVNNQIVYISHSHNSKPNIISGSKGNRLFKKTISGLMRVIIRKKADALFACSKEAGLYLFGEKGIRSNKFCIVPNAIETGKFKFNKNIRQKLRNKENFIIGFAGRLELQKNPIFAVNVFYEILKKNQNAVLWIIGDGDKKTAIEKRIKEFKIQDKVFMLGQRNDVSDLMQAMDILLFPSFYEGFGIVAIEAQCSGLRVAASDSVPDSVNLTGLVSFLPLSESPEYWADYIISNQLMEKNREDMSEIIKNAGYDIKIAAEKLEDQYMMLLREKHKS
ncbi:MAG: glycosyltransferase [Anaerolineaceae bacterium]|nr:glycosyltransferase [Anaerolineaceae bacterium]